MAKTISNSFTVNIVEDGESTPYYFQEWYAWSNDTSTANVTTAPTIDGSWQTSIPNKGSYAYLWRKSIRFVWQESTRTYIQETAQYFRMSGTDGTSIKTRGSVTDASKRSASGTATLTNGTTITMSDGDAVTQLDDGHLYQWVTESGGSWLDLGQFKGENGKTYYSHIVYATNVNYSGSTVTSIEGYTPTKSPNDTTHFWMGTYVDENSADPTSGSDPVLLEYTWSYTKGANGEDAYSVEVNPTSVAFECNANGDIKNYGGITVVPKMYKGTTLVSHTLSALSATNGLFVYVSSGQITLYGRLAGWYKGSGASRVYAYTLKPWNELSVGDGVYNYAYNTFVLVGEITSVTQFVLNVSDGTTTQTYYRSSSTADYVANLSNPATLTFTVTSEGVSRNVEMQITGNKVGAQGKMSRNLYFAGMLSDIGGNTFTATDHKAPYVDVETGTSPLTPTCYMYVGANGTNIAFPTTAAAYQSSDDWEIMTSDFKYLITQAIFAEFAKLGSWIFNGDYMFSQTGVDGTTNYEDFEGESGAWQPNLYMNALTGRLVANDIVLRGVINNLINSIGSANWNSFGYYEHTGTTVEDLQGNLYLNPLKCGQYIDFDFSSHDLTIVLPSYCIESTSLPKKDATHNFTLTELRQMVGKSIVIMPKGMGQSAPSLRSEVMYERVENYNDGWSDLGYKVGGQSVANGDTTTTTYSLQRTNSYNFAVTSQSFILRAVCKTGQYRNRECIYWEVSAIQSAG